MPVLPKGKKKKAFFQVLWGYVGVKEGGGGFKRPSGTVMGYGVLSVLCVSHPVDTVSSE